MDFIGFIKTKFEEKTKNDADFQTLINQYDANIDNFHQEDDAIISELRRIEIIPQYYCNAMPGRLLGEYKDTLERKISLRKAIIEYLKNQLDKTKFRKRKIAKQIEKNTSILFDLEKVAKQLKKYEVTYKEFDKSCGQMDKAIYHLAESIVSENRNEPVIADTFAEGFKLAEMGMLPTLRDRAAEFDHGMIQTLAVRTAYRTLYIIESTIKNELKQTNPSQPNETKFEFECNSKSDTTECQK